MRGPEHRRPGRLERLTDGAHDARMTVSEDQRSERETVVDVRISVDVPESTTLRGLHGDRVGIEVLHARRDAAGKGPPRAARIGRRTLGPLEETVGSRDLFPIVDAQPSLRPR